MIIMMLPGTCGTIHEYHVFSSFNVESSLASARHKGTRYYHKPSLRCQGNLKADFRARAGPDGLRVSAAVLPDHRLGKGHRLRCTALIGELEHLTSPSPLSGQQPTGNTGPSRAAGRRRAGGEGSGRYDAGALTQHTGLASDLPGLARAESRLSARSNASESNPAAGPAAKLCQPGKGSAQLELAPR